MASGGPRLARFRLGQILAHQRAHRLIAPYRSVLGLFVPRVGPAVVGDVAEPLVERPGAWVALLHRELGPVPAAGADPLLGGLDEEGADPARLQRPVHRELPEGAGARAGA